MYEAVFGLKYKIYMFFDIYIVNSYYEQTDTKTSSPIIV